VHRGFKNKNEDAADVQTCNERDTEREAGQWPPLKLACRATVMKCDVERIKNDAAPTGARGKVIVVRIGGICEMDSAGQRHEAGDFRAVEVVAACASGTKRDKDEKERAEADRSWLPIM
jgi:hypothetical protein